MLKLLPTPIKKIAVFRALQLGDMLCIIPAMRALRAAYPHAEITLISLPWAKTFVERFHNYFDNFIAFPGYPGLPEQHFDPLTFPAFIEEVQTRQFDLALQMQGNGTLVNPLMELFGAKHEAGFKTAGHYAADNGLFLSYPDFGSEIERHIALMQHLGIEPAGTYLEFPIMDKDNADLNALNLPLQPKKYVCVHPGSRGAWRQWPVKHFAALADYCYEQGYKIVVTGTKDEIKIVNEVISNMHHEAINAAGKTSLGAIGVLIKNAAMLISNCTGVSHIASAVKTPSIVISMDGEPDRWGPINKHLHRTINWLAQPDLDHVYHQLTDLENMTSEEV